MSCCGAFVMPTELVSPARPGNKPEPRHLTGRHVLLMMIAFFAVIAAVNAFMIAQALRTMPGVETKSAYEASQNYNRELGRIAEQDRRGWQVDVSATGLGKGAPLVVEARDREGRPLVGLEGKVLLERPADARFDRRLALVEQGGGRYIADAGALEPGQWQIEVDLNQGGQRLFTSRRKVLLAH